MLGQLASNLEAFIQGIDANRRDGAFSVFTPDLRMIAQVCSGATTKHQLRNRQGYAPSTFDRLVEKGQLLRGDDHGLWISDSAAHVLFGLVRAFEELDEALEGASRPDRWPFQTRDTDPFNGAESLLGPPLLHVLGKDLKDYGWGRQRIARFGDFLDEVGLHSGDEPTGALEKARTSLVQGFEALAPANGSRENGSNVSSPPGLVAKLQQIDLQGRWTSPEVEGELRIPWHRVPPRIDQAELEFGGCLELDSNIRTVSAGRGIEPRISLSIEEGSGQDRNWLPDLFRFLSGGSVRLLFNGVSHRGVLVPGREPGLRVDGRRFHVSAVDVTSSRPSGSAAPSREASELPIPFSR
jgi:hypothetical protein